jgi:hypothetical protein
MLVFRNTNQRIQPSLILASLTIAAEFHVFRNSKAANFGRSTFYLAFLILFIYLFDSRDNAIHLQGICGLGNTPPSAVRCAQVSGCEPPLQENVEKER